MRNELTTTFIFNDKESAKIDALSTKLTSLDTKLNSLGQNPTFGFGLTTGLTKGSDALGKLGAGVDSLKTKTESFAPQPTISRYYETEEKVVKSKLESITASIDKAKASINPLTRPDLFSSNLKTSQPAEFGKPDNALFENVRKTRLEVQKLNAEKISTGKFDGLTQAGVRLHDQLGKTQADILRINNALKNTNNKTVIDELNNDLAVAEDRFDRVNSRIRHYENRQNGSGKQTAGRQGGRRGGISDGALTALELADDFVPEGFNRPFNAAARGMLAVNAASLTTLATFGALAVAGVGIVKITENIRSQAESRLRNEELIAGAINKQVISLRDSLSEYEKFKQTLRESEGLTNRLAENVANRDTKAAERERERIDQNNKSRITEINRLQADLAAKERFLEFSKTRSVNQNLFTELGLGREYTASQKAQDIANATSDVEKTRKELDREQNALERGKAALGQIEKTFTDIRDKQDKDFDKRWESWKKSQELIAKAQESAIKREKQINEEIEKRNQLAKQLIVETRDFLISVNPSDNPLVKLMSDFESATGRAEKKFADFKKVLSPVEFKKFIGEMSELDRRKNQREQAKTIYGFESEALKYRQEARRIDRLPLTQTYEFTKSLSTIERSVQHIATSTDLLRKSSEANFYAFQYNPNNPKSFNESRFSFGERDRFAETAGARRKGETFEEFELRRQEAIESGINVFDAVSDIKKFSFKAAELLTDVTDIYGQEIVANEIIKRMPSKEDLLRQLGSPYAAIRENAQYLLSQQADAFFTLRQANDRKFEDALGLQSYQDLRRTDFKEQITSLKSATGLEREFSLKTALGLANELGIDKLDRKDRLDFRAINLELSRINLHKQDEGRKQFDRFEQYIKAIAEALVKGGIKLDPASLPAQSPTVVNVNAKDFDKKESTGSAPNNQHTHDYYRIGDVHDAGDLYGSKLVNR